MADLSPVASHISRWESHSICNSRIIIIIKYNFRSTRLSIRIEIWIQMPTRLAVKKTINFEVFQFQKSSMRGAQFFYLISPCLSVENSILKQGKSIWVHFCCWPPCFAWVEWIASLGSLLCGNPHYVEQVIDGCDIKFTIPNPSGNLAFHENGLKTKQGIIYFSLPNLERTYNVSISFVSVSSLSILRLTPVLWKITGQTTFRHNNAITKDHVYNACVNVSKRLVLG